RKLGWVGLGRAKIIMLWVGFRILGYIDIYTRDNRKNQSQKIGPRIFTFPIRDNAKKIIQMGRAESLTACDNGRLNTAFPRPCHTVRHCAATATSPLPAPAREISSPSSLKSLPNLSYHCSPDPREAARRWSTGR
ncbi:unnamed protein product, partial [Urochloa humidicola]